MSIIGTLCSGLVVGLLARAIKPGVDAMGWIMTIVLGIVGAAVGGYIAGMLNITSTGWIGSTIISVLGAVLVLFIYEIVIGRRTLK